MASQDSDVCICDVQAELGEGLTGGSRLPGSLGERGPGSSGLAGPPAAPCRLLTSLQQRGAPLDQET